MVGSISITLLSNNKNYLLSLKDELNNSKNELYQLFVKLWWADLQFIENQNDNGKQFRKIKLQESSMNFSQEKVKKLLNNCTRNFSKYSMILKSQYKSLSSKIIMIYFYYLQFIFPTIKLCKISILKNLQIFIKLFSNTYIGKKFCLFINFVQNSPIYINLHIFFKEMYSETKNDTISNFKKYFNIYIWCKNKITRIDFIISHTIYSLWLIHRKNIYIFFNGLLSNPLVRTYLNKFLLFFNFYIEQFKQIWMSKERSEINSVIKKKTISELDLNNKKKKNVNNEFKEKDQENNRTFNDILKKNNSVDVEEKENKNKSIKKP